MIAKKVPNDSLDIQLYVGDQFFSGPKGPKTFPTTFSPFFFRESSLIALDCTFRKDIPIERHQQPQDTCKLRRPMQPKVGPPGPILVL